MMLSRFYYRTALHRRFQILTLNNIILFQVGAEVQLTLLFADVHGSTQLAEVIGVSAFHHLSNRFYTASTEILVQSNALIDKLIGDEVAGIYLLTLGVIWRPEDKW